jgi:hypothetical protein
VAHKICRPIPSGRWCWSIVVGGRGVVAGVDEMVWLIRYADPYLQVGGAGV